MKVHLWPRFGGEDEGDGGVRQVWEGQVAHLPAQGIELVDDPDEADVLAIHILAPPAYLVRYPRKPIVAHCHGLYWSEYEWGDWALKANADVMELLRVADIITTPSEWVAQAVRRHTMRDVRVVLHGVSLPAPAPSVVPTPEGAAFAGALPAGAGYVLWNKTRPDPVCDPAPMNQVAAMLPDVPFVSTFGAQASNVVLTDRLPHEAALRLVEDAGVYLCTARETFGIGTLEALAAGVPVVGFRWGGQVEIIEHGVDGWLAIPGDIEGLAKGIRWALANREEIALRAHAKAALYSWERACESYAAIYREAWERRQEERPKVSVIVTAYNLDRYLDDCLRSVADQSFEDWECVVVDDASPDDCGRIADGWARSDTRFKVIHNKTNQYLAESRNIGIAASRGEYVLPLDADDMLPPETLEILSKALDENRRIDIAYGGVMFVEEAEDNRRWHSGWPMEFRLDLQLRGPGQLLPYASMYRRRVWELTGGYRRRCRSSEDQDMWLRAPSYGFRPMKVTDADCLIYRNRADSMSRAEGWRDHRGWYPWTRDLKLAPASAVHTEQLPVPSCDPPVVAVIIPVGPGHERYVIDAVDSVDAQTLRQWECIVVNDTGGELPRLPSWVRIVDNHGPRGVASARNAGIAASRAILFLPLDADDYLQPEALRLMFEAHRKTGDIIYTDFWEDPKEEGRFSVWELPDYQPERLISHGTIHAVTALTPKTVWQAVGGYDEDLPAWEDWAFQIAAADKGACSRRLAMPLWTYRKHTGTRRDENVRNFEESKNGILSKWEPFWKGGKTPMACRTCGQRATIQAPAVATGFKAQGAPANQGGDGAVLVRYTGTIVGRRRYKRLDGGQPYAFDAGDPPRYVLKRDYDAFFSRRPDFELVSEPVLTPAAAADAPALLAEGPPVRGSGPEMTAEAPTAPTPTRRRRAKATA